VSAWWIVAMLPVALWAIWQLFALVDEMFRQAAHRREDLKTHKERDGSAL
jgi:hypothetical protein